MRALVARWPSLADVWLRFAGVPLRHAGTMGGNVANGSPIGDSPPVLMALDASVRAAPRRARAPPAAWPISTPATCRTGSSRASSCRRSRCRSTARTAVRAYKISKRFDCDISAVCAGLAIELDDARRRAHGALRLRRHGGHGRSAPPPPKRRSWASRGTRPPSPPRSPRSTPISRRSPTCAPAPRYRRQVAKNLLRRLWLETRRDAPLGDQRDERVERDAARRAGCQRRAAMNHAVDPPC